jgi:hypothetical protein
MVDFGDHNDEYDEPTSTHIRRAARKYRGHKLARGIGHNKIMRGQGGEAAH